MPSQSNLSDRRFASLLSLAVAITGSSGIGHLLPTPASQLAGGTRPIRLTQLGRQYGARHAQSQQHASLLIPLLNSTFAVHSFHNLNPSSTAPPS